MDVQSVTVGLPVSDLERAAAWYRRVFALSTPNLAPADGVVEFQLGTIWLQLGEESTSRSGAGVVTRFGVSDATAERERLIGEGVEVGRLEHVPDAVDYFDFLDPDGNRLSLYSELQSRRAADRASGGVLNGEAESPRTPRPGAFSHLRR